MGKLLPAMRCIWTSTTCHTYTMALTYQTISRWFHCGILHATHMFTTTCMYYACYMHGTGTWSLHASYMHVPLTTLNMHGSCM